MSLLLAGLFHCGNHVTEARFEALDTNAQIDLQDGFAGNVVRLELNGATVLDSSFSNLVPFAGPVMSLPVATRPGKNELTIEWTCIDPAANCITYRQSKEFVRGNQALYIYLDVHGGVVDFKAQNEPLFYL